MKSFTLNNISSLEFTRVVPRVKAVEAVEIEEPFEVLRGDGDIESGKAGDYLLCVDDSQIHVVSAEEFKSGYRPYQEKLDGVQK